MARGHGRSTLPDDYFCAYLATSSGGTDLNAAGSSASGALTYYVTPSTSKGSAVITNLAIDLQAPDVFLEDGFGASTSPLTNGIKLQAVTSSGDVVHDFLGGVDLTRNSEFFLLSAGGVLNEDPSTENNEIHQKTALLDFEAGQGQSMVLGVGAKLQMTIQDDVSSSGTVTYFRAFARGYYPD